MHTYSAPKSYGTMFHVTTIRYFSIFAIFSMFQLIRCVGELTGFVRILLIMFKSIREIQACDFNNRSNLCDIGKYTLQRGSCYCCHRI